MDALWRINQIRIICINTVLDIFRFDRIAVFRERQGNRCFDIRAADILTDLLEVFLI